MPEAKIIFWDVEHGHASYLCTPNGRHIVIDLGTGSYDSGDEFSPLNHLKYHYGKLCIFLSVNSVPLGEAPYLFLDARYEQVRLEGRIVDCAVVMAVGIAAGGRRRVLGCEIAASAAENRLATVSRKPSGPWLAGGEAEHCRRPRRTQGGPPGGVARGALAALPVLPAIECRSLRYAPGGEKNGGRPDARHLQCAG
ncbi:hypothetical protein Atep_18790 [Allochromatium tepidum]|uniref:Uncharacterized protein n=1 Tax=Allochromatium tepidum TaxID=553982 RepID=A0ABN6GCM1_9GAMM|nr:hypothetical protein Atep_18790 [Allochromatium tepidum]